MNGENKPMPISSPHRLACLFAAFALPGIADASALTWAPNQDGSGTGGAGAWNAANTNRGNETSDVAWTRGATDKGGNGRITKRTWVVSKQPSHP